MIVLDTNVVSELTRREPNRNVLTWVDRYPPDDVFLTATTVAELLYGIARMPDGTRKRGLSSRMGTLLDVGFAGQILAFTADAAVDYARIVSARERDGRPVTVADAQIAAVCRLHDAELLTHNVKDFAGTGVRVVDPWTAPGHLA